jgi:hypothetical protein
MLCLVTWCVAIRDYRDSDVIHDLKVDVLCILRRRRIMFDVLLPVQLILQCFYSRYYKIGQ